MKIPTLIGKLWRLAGSGLGRDQTPMPSAVARFIAFSREKWPQDHPTDPGAVVLVSAYPWKESVFCYAYAANCLARATRASIRSFLFKGSRRRGNLEEIYASFGARFDLGMDDAKRFEKEAAALADKIFRGLRTKADVVNISINGIPLGDHIYDFYLRQFAQVTIDLGDDRLKNTIFEAALIYFAAKEYLAAHRVTALLPDHLLYLNCGILTRLASLAGVPIYQMGFGPDFLLTPITFQDAGADAKFHSLGRPYPQYRELFARLTPDEQQKARARGRQKLTDRLAGKVDSCVMPGLSAYQDGEAKPVLTDSGKPRVLVLLHEFSDAPHIFRKMLFADFYEWIYFLLERAEKTPFQWYVKPHPDFDEPSRKAINEANQRVVDELRERFPNVIFLPSSASNRQIVAEGIASMFTVHGTAGHEFAYLGVPVVNAGDNPHIKYSFNFHARSLEDYESYIERAGHLEIAIDRSEIEEFIYMNYLYMMDKYRWEANPIVRSLVDAPDYLQRCQKPEILDDFMAGVTPENDLAIARCFEKFLLQSEAERAAEDPAAVVLG